MVYIAACGSIACTSPYYANTGMLSKHILSVFRCGHISLNVVSHLHPLYVEAHAFTLAAGDPNVLQSFTCFPSNIKYADKFTQITAAASWKWCVNYTADVWREVGLGGESHRSAVFPVPDAITNAPASKNEKLTKDIHKLVAVLRSNQEEQNHFYEYLARVQERAEAAAVLKDRARKRIFDVNLHEISAITTIASSGKSRKRKVAGDFIKVKKKHI